MAQQLKKENTIMHEIIKRHYALVNDKRGFCDKLGKKLGISGQSVFNHYFGTYLNIPAKNREVTLRELEKELRKQVRQIEMVFKLTKLEA